MSALKFFLKSLLKQPRQTKAAQGFTLLELLIALALTFLIITPLMTLVISLMGNDRQEQAKVTSQQEIQAALDYIAQDLQQAIYVYDAQALSNPTSTDATTSGIVDQIPPVQQAPGCNDSSTCVPVLAFWKRKYFARTDTVTDPITNANVSIASLNDSSRDSDRFVYSLVVYYLIKDSNPTWSKVARIGRFEIRDGIINPDTPPPPNPAPPAVPPAASSGNYLLAPDIGFNRFDLSLSPASVQQSLNSWIKSSGAYTQKVETLVDFIDDTDVQKFRDASLTQFVPPENDGGDVSTICSNNATGTDADLNPTSSRVPPDSIDQLQIGSFYACVNPSNTQGQSVVQVFVRGNALPRISNDQNTWHSIDTKALSYRPTASVRVAVRGLLSSNQSK